MHATTFSIGKDPQRDGADSEDGTPNLMRETISRRHPPIEFFTAHDVLYQLPQKEMDVSRLIGCWVCKFWLAPCRSMASKTDCERLYESGYSL